MIADVALMFLGLLYDVMPAHFIMLLCLVVVMFSQVVNTSEGLEGFSSTGVVS